MAAVTEGIYEPLLTVSSFLPLIISEAAGPARVGIDPSFYSRVKFKDLTG